MAHDLVPLIPIRLLSCFILHINIKNSIYKTVTLKLIVDTEYGSVMDYFEIFLSRMLLCRKAAEFFSLKFRMIINGSVVL